MLASLFAWGAARWGKTLPILVAVLILLALASLGAWSTVAIVDGWITAAAAAARLERDTHWRGEIEQSNRKVAEADAQRTAAVAALEAGAGAEIATLRQQLTALEAQNASLPGADDCGVSHDRVRLLRAR